jgi:hypothetical protein
MKGISASFEIDNQQNPIVKGFPFFPPVGALGDAARRPGKRSGNGLLIGLGFPFFSTL